MADLTNSARLFEEVRACAMVLAIKDLDEDKPKDEEENVDLSDDLGITFGDELESSPSPSDRDIVGVDETLVSEIHPDGKQGAVATDTLTCELYVRAFLERLMEEDPKSPRPALSTATNTTCKGFICSLCEKDTTTNPTQKERLWGLLSRLERHQTSGFHNGDTQSSRKMHNATPDKKNYKCPYPSCSKGEFFFATLNGLKVYIIKDARAIGRSPHQVAIRGDQWLDVGFAVSRETGKSHAKKRKLELDDDYEEVLVERKVVRHENGIPLLFAGPNPVPGNVIDGPEGDLHDFEEFLQQAAEDKMFSSGPNEYR